MHIVNNYRLLKKLGKGSYGEVWKAQHIHKKRDVAIKFEKKSRKKYLKLETIILRYLSNVSQVPFVKFYGEIDNFNYVILELLGATISEYYYNIPKFDIGEIKWIGMKMLSSIREIHNSGIIHRDIKPENFLLTCNQKNIKLIDFGLAKYYMDENGNHRKLLQHNHIMGTPRYISIYVHERNDPSRRDDLISFVYTLLFLLGYGLPWQGTKGTTREEKLNNIYVIKKNISNDDLCKIVMYDNTNNTDNNTDSDNDSDNNNDNDNDNNNNDNDNDSNNNNKLFEKMKHLLDYTYSLTYDETPNYDYILFLLKTIL